MWVTYKTNTIKACSPQLIADRWTPMVLAWFSADSHKSIKHLHGELSETGKTEQEVNGIAVGKPKNRGDQQSTG